MPGWKPMRLGFAFNLWQRGACFQQGRAVRLIVPVFNADAVRALRVRLLLLDVMRPGVDPDLS
ncbi:MAG: hypothetical protein JXA97_03350 [Anaerolineales bacterium]|nr:hypothetical protein [Anaerolineales bacterium]